MAATTDQDDVCTDDEREVVETTPETVARCLAKEVTDETGMLDFGIALDGSLRHAYHDEFFTKKAVDAVQIEEALEPASLLEDPYISYDVREAMEESLAEEVAGEEFEATAWSADITGRYEQPVRVVISEQGD